MLTKIKNFLKKVTVLEWAILGIALAALVIALTVKPGPTHKGPRGGDKAPEKAHVEKAPQ